MTVDFVYRFSFYRFKIATDASHPRNDEYFVYRFSFYRLEIATDAAHPRNDEDF